MIFTDLLAIWTVVIMTFFGPVEATPYYLTTNCEPENFFECFGFYTGSDPTNGFVKYVDESAATSAKLLRASATQLYLGVDTTHVLPTNGPGRPSIRLESRDTYTHGLYVLNVSHVPAGCATWPAFWSFGPNWPSNGEIDVLETANGATQNLISLHTSSNCSIAGSGQSGKLLTNNCDVGYSTTGCSVQSTSSFSAGAEANRAGGGIYVMEWTSSSIRVWNFPPSAVPASLRSNTPNPNQFGQPVANFQGSCDIDKHFANHKIVIDTTFCGDYAGNIYGSSGCPLTKGQTGAQSCVSYVAKNPQAFTQAYWLIDSLKVYQIASGAASSAAARTSSTSLSSVRPVASSGSVSSMSLAMGSSSAKTTSTSSPTSRPSASRSTPSTSSSKLTPASSSSFGSAPSSTKSASTSSQSSKPTSTSSLSNTSSSTKSGSTIPSTSSSHTSTAGPTKPTNASPSSTSSRSSGSSSHNGVTTHPLPELARLASGVNATQSTPQDNTMLACTPSNVRADQAQVPPSSGECTTTPPELQAGPAPSSTEIAKRTVTSWVKVIMRNCTDSLTCPSAA